MIFKKISIFAIQKYDFIPSCSAIGLDDGIVILKLLSLAAPDLPGEFFAGDVCQAKPAKPPLSLASSELLECTGCYSSKI